ncbi:TPA: tRNA (adenosine(37)-N6)-dimethylallyltransferase MiaA [Candidatus Micrarchaeota archaeon]|nr:tRNA (adenosine(37)-N6)-dimethylallyltransferase MiaA [Candidatus Micrarchaeota archaeon]
MKIPLIVGPTAVGKSEIAVELAEIILGEVVSADARAVYRDLEVGTAKPPPELRRRVLHHLLDIVPWWEKYDAVRFREDCERVTREILDRGKIPVIVGGSTLYVRALTVGIFQGPGASPAIREELAKLPTKELYRELKRVDPVAASKIGPADRVRIVRALEVYRLTGKPISSFWGKEEPFPWRLLVVGITMDRRELYRRIEARVEEMFRRGLIDEARLLFRTKLPRETPVLRTIGYEELFDHFRGLFSLGEAKRKIVANTKAYARRQYIWFRREPGIRWIDRTGKPPRQVAEEIAALLREESP